MRVAVWIAVASCTAVLVAYPPALAGWEPVPAVAAGAGVIAVILAVVFGRSWLASVAVALFVLEYVTALIADGLAFDAFVLVEAAFALLLLEALDVVSLMRRVPEVDAKVLTARLGLVGYAGGLGLFIALGGVAVASAVPRDHDPLVFALGAVAVAAAGVTIVFVSSRRVRTPITTPERPPTGAT